MTTLHRAHVRRPDGSVYAVKNLGWILRQWKRIDRMEWFKLSAFPSLDPPNPCIEGVFRVYLTDGTMYATMFASFAVWCRWIDRPVLRGLQVTVNGITGTV